MHVHVQPLKPVAVVISPPSWTRRLEVTGFVVGEESFPETAVIEGKRGVAAPCGGSVPLRPKA